MKRWVLLQANKPNKHYPTSILLHMLMFMESSRWYTYHAERVLVGFWERDSCHDCLVRTYPSPVLEVLWPSVKTQRSDSGHHLLTYGEVTRIVTLSYQFFSTPDESFSFKSLPRRSSLRWKDNHRASGQRRRDTGSSIDVDGQGGTSCCGKITWYPPSSWPTLSYLKI